MTRALTRIILNNLQAIFSRSHRATDSLSKCLQVAPLPEHYGDFADLCAKVAERYPDVEAFQGSTTYVHSSMISRFRIFRDFCLRSLMNREESILNSSYDPQVWNELKGFWNRDENRWAYENYTEMYNMVYLRVKEVNPVAKVGGKYLQSNYILHLSSSSCLLRSLHYERRGVQSLRLVRRVGVRRPAASGRHRVLAVVQGWGRLRLHRWQPEGHVLGRGLQVLNGLE